MRSNQRRGRRKLGAHGKIFVSYRRDDAPGDARSIYERLERSFGERNVFMDVDQLLAGQRFDRELDKALASTAGILKDKDYPQFKDQASINEWVRAQRRTEEAS